MSEEQGKPTTPPAGTAPAGLGGADVSARHAVQRLGKRPQENPQSAECALPATGLLGKTRRQQARDANAATEGTGQYADGDDPHPYPAARSSCTRAGARSRDRKQAP